MVIVLLLVSVGMFIALVHRVALLQVNHMLIFTGNHGRKVIEKIYQGWNLRLRAMKRTIFAHYHTLRHSFITGDLSRYKRSTLQLWLTWPKRQGESSR